MRVGWVRWWVAASVVTSGVVMVAAAVERWGAVCPPATALGASDLSDACFQRSDHLYDFLAPTEPWAPVGSAATLGGLSLLVLALAVPLLATALTGRRPRALAVVAVAVAELALVDIGVANLRSGLAGEVVDPAAGGLSFALWVWLLPAGFGWLVGTSHGWARLSALLLLLGSPLVAAFTYAIGPFDAQPWWEGTSGSLTALGGLALVVAAVHTRGRTRRSGGHRHAAARDVSDAPGSGWLRA
ncbi:MAG: hypothetical protein U0R80_02195 [Nocardioidaceae bacterium]